MTTTSSSSATSADEPSDDPLGLGERRVGELFPEPVVPTSVRPATGRAIGPGMNPMGVPEPIGPAPEPTAPTLEPIAPTLEPIAPTLDPMTPDPIALPGIGDPIVPRPSSSTDPRLLGPAPDPIGREPDPIGSDPALSATTPFFGGPIGIGIPLVEDEACCPIGAGNCCVPGNVPLNDRLGWP